ncbi:MAG: RNA-directed DNA polymerase, partial [Gammaproteobacteria bacterium]|nr:RNA-directed DNA polymerase [Gammaproteobacteria bacterium]
IHIKDPKPRRISAAPFRDRVVHHALCHEVEPIFERGFIHDSYANRCGKGTHAGVERYERFRGGAAYVLRCDIYRYFPAIDHLILKQDLRRRITSSGTLWLLDTIIDGSNPQEPVLLRFPGDDLLTPVERRRGLPIGNLTSQFLANVYLDSLDHFVKEILRCRRYLRYVDDFALFHDDAGQLQEWQDRIRAFLTGRRLILHPEKTRIMETARPAEF